MWWAWFGSESGRQAFLVVIPEGKPATAKFCEEVTNFVFREGIANRIVLGGNYGKSGAISERAPHYDRDHNVFVSRDAGLGSGTTGFVPVSFFE